MTMTSTPSRPITGEPRLREGASPAGGGVRDRIEAVDGLRALAVVAVLAFHLAPGVMPGGFLGVDVFFVISGYVITSMLAQRLRATGSLDLRDFLIARTRRLLPALVIAIVVTVGVAAALRHPGLARALADVPYILTGLYNWHLADAGVFYFDQWSPPLLQHAWSLAVEAQYYLLWPLLLLAATRRLSSGRIAQALIAAAVGLVAWEWVSGSMSTQASHHYFATHTHLLGLLLGSALGLVWTPQHLSRRVSGAARRTLDVGALATVAALAALLLTVAPGGALYGMWFSLSAVLTALLLATTVHPAGMAGRVLAHPAATAIGRRSYSLYLWHWPVVLLNPAGNGLLGDAITLAVTVALAEVSYRLIEVPCRRARGAAAWRVPALRIGVPAVVASLIVAAVGAPVAVSAAHQGANAPTSPTPSSTQLASSPTAPDSASPSSSQSSATSPSSVPTTTSTPPSMSAASAPEPVMDVDVAAIVGDSVLLGIRDGLPDGVTVERFDAVVGRQADEVLKVLRRLPVTGDGQVVIINLGNNGLLTRRQAEAIMRELGRFSHGIVINAAVPRPWQDANNALLAELAVNHPSVTVLDWQSTSEGREEYFAPDGVHLTPSGADAYVRMLESGLAAVATADTGS